MELPGAKGTYVLIAFMAQMKRLDIGCLGTCQLLPGFYAYVGSARGAGGLRARVGHHLESTAEPHWHIDYLLQWAVPTEVWYAAADANLEHQWAELLEKANRFRVAVRRFGSSDYHRSRSSHLFFSKRQPSFRWFEQQVREQFEGVQAEQCVINSCDAPAGRQLAPA